jgi:hypothetical protein
MFTDADPDVFKESYGTLHLCKYPGVNSIWIIDAKWITAVVGMVPLKYTHGERNYLESKQYFVVEKMSGILIPKHNTDEDSEE